MNTTRTLIEQNTICLRQGIALLRELDDAAYTHTQSPYYESSVGEHLRHTLEHYISFIDGVESGLIDYDARERNRRIAAERAYAVRVIRDIIARLEGIAVDKPLQVKMDCGHGETEKALWSRSSIERDLQYIQAHTIHHYALIAMILRLQGIDPGPDFGVAPSTLAYRRSLLQAEQQAG
jgi:hypothetical protein